MKEAAMDMVGLADRLNQRDNGDEDRARGGAE